MTPYAAFRARFLDVLASIYIYNEHRGYTSLDRVLEAVLVVNVDRGQHVEKAGAEGGERRHSAAFSIS